MTSRTALALAAALLCAAVATPGRAQPEPQPPPDKEAVREIVREYLLEHPEIIEEAIRALQAKRQADQAVRTRDALVKNRVALVDHPMSPVSGNPDGDVTLVEFFDYQCGYCKRSLEPVMDLLETDPGLRVVWKDFPVLGQVSTFAALASMAAQKQGKYLELHKALMGASERLTEESVMEIAGQAGLDVATPAAGHGRRGDRFLPAGHPASRPRARDQRDPGLRDREHAGARRGGRRASQTAHRRGPQRRLRPPAGGRRAGPATPPRRSGAGRRGRPR